MNHSCENTSLQNVSVENLQFTVQEPSVGPFITTSVCIYPEMVFPSYIT